MSIKSQQANMKIIHSLVSQDLGYIYGERENGPSGAKKQFLTKAAAFLRALGNDLGLNEFRVTTNPGGIAVSGDVTLIGMWCGGNGLYFQLSQPLQPFNSFLYRTVRHMKDYSGGNNRWLPDSLFGLGNYERLIGTLTELNEHMEVERLAA
jgi:hypothetical protein